MSPGVFVVVLGLWPGVSPPVQAQPQTVECADWRACRDATEAALASDETERAHDLAWRAVQRGPKDDAASMFLLARAQARSGRSDDALVMVRRLAQRGARTDAETHPDLERVRALPGWAEVAPLVAAANAGAPAATAAAAASAEAAPRRGGRNDAARSASAATWATSATSATPEAAAALEGAGGPPAATRRPGAATHRASDARAEDALRFTAEPFRAGGLAYDAVSHRFLLGDRDGRKLRVAAEGLAEAVDLVREQSAGFRDVRAVEIDARRGDLWVASADATGAAAALHKLQLVSGRPLRTYPVAGAGGDVRLADLAVADSGAVVALDDRGHVYRLRPGAAAASAAATIGGGAASSLALVGNGDVAYVSHAGGLTRVDLASGDTTAVTAPADVPLTGIERLRAHRGGLVAIQAGADGTRHVMRYELAASGSAVRGVTSFDVRIAAAAGPVFATVVGDDLAFVSTGAVGAAPGALTEFAVRRVRLR